MTSLTRWQGGGVIDDEQGTVFIDTLFAALAAFVVVVALSLWLINPANDSAKRASISPGNVSVHMYWPFNLAADVDLWVQAPGNDPVGYSNLVTSHMNLLRDDVGVPTRSSNDKGNKGVVTPLEDKVNYEVVYSRGIPIGEYCVNVHLYASAISAALPIDVRVVVEVYRAAAGAEDGKGKSEPILAGNVKLTHEKHEVNVFCFTLDSTGELIDPKTTVYQSDTVQLAPIDNGHYDR